MNAPSWIALACVALYVLFHVWYGGRGRPLAPDETRDLLAELQRRVALLPANAQARIDDVQALVAHDDGREFVMFNLVRYRAKADYPPGSPYGDDPRAADKRYGRAIVWPLLRRASLMWLVAPKAGRFIELPGAPDWHYVAMVRYRSRRDFLRFAIDIEREDVVLHKWAAIAATHVFPVRPLISLVFVRSAVAVVIGLCGVTMAWILR
jgi:hypothetical protein